LNSVPVLGQKGQKHLIPIKGMVPTPTEKIRGCPFAPRCPRVMNICREYTPALTEVAAGHSTACWLYEGVVAEKDQKGDSRSPLPAREVRPIAQVPK